MPDRRKAGRIRWVRGEGGRGHVWTGYSGEIVVAIVLQPSYENPAGRWSWRMDGVVWRWLGASQGEVATATAGRRACEKAWARWLGMAGLETVHVG